MTGDVRITRRRLLQTASVGGLALLVPSAALARTARSAKLSENVVLRWNDALLQGVRDSKLGPPMVARALAVAHTCIFDAWAAYDRVAVGTQLGGALRRPARERRFDNKVEAISFAAYRAAVDLFPASRAGVFDGLMADLGFDPGDRSTDAASAVGIGNLTADAVLAFRHRDGANQLGDEPGGAFADGPGPVRVLRVRRAGSGADRRERSPHGRAEDDRRVLGGRATLGASTRALEPVRAAGRAP